MQSESLYSIASPFVHFAKVLIGLAFDGKRKTWRIAKRTILQRFRSVVLIIFLSTHFGSFIYLDNHPIYCFKNIETFLHLLRFVVKLLSHFKDKLNRRLPIKDMRLKTALLLHRMSVASEYVKIISIG